jgi:PAS domain-containing protein
MNRFILHETIKRFQEILRTDLSVEERQYATAELASMQRELALLDAAFLGGQRYSNQIGQPSAGDQRLFQSLIENSSEALLIIDPRPGLHIVDMTPSFEIATLTEKRSALGHELFHLYPDNPELPDADGVSNVLRSLRAAAYSGVSQTMGIQRYDVRDADGRFVERYWRPLHVPILNDEGDLVWLLTQLEDVTAQCRG